MNDADINYTKEAFLHPYNLAFLLVALVSAFALNLAVGGSIFTLTLLFSFAAELLYLGVVPRNARFRRAVRSQRIEAHRKPPSQKELFQHLSRESQRRYARLRQLRDDIEANYRRLSYASQGLLDSHLGKIDGLIASFLNLLHQKERYETGTRGHSEAELQRAIDELRDDMSDDADRVKSIKERRLHILQQRLGRSKKGQENHEIIEAQLETVEDVVKYIHEQSWTLQNPDEISLQLDTLLSEVEDTQTSVREIEDVFGRSADDLLGDLDDESGASEPRPGRHRQRG